MSKEETLSKTGMGVLILITLGLLGFLIAFFVDSSILIGNCRNNIPSENCNNPAGDFAVEPNTSSSNVEFGCGPDENAPCIFTNITTLNDAIKKCNSLENKCNRFIFENNTMTVVSLVGDTIESTNSHIFVRQNGITYQGQGTQGNTFRTTNITGENSSVTSNSNTFSQPSTTSGTNSLGSTLFGVGY